MSLLSIVQGAAKELNIVPPTTVVAATDAQTKQLLALASKEGKDLLRRYNWQALLNEGTFTTVASATQVSAITTTFTNFFRFVDGSMFNRTQKRKVFGPIRPQEWQRRQAFGVDAGIQAYFRVRAGAILFYPTPAAGDSIYFEYVSSKWCQSSGGTAQTDWAADTDTALIDEEVIRLGVVWRWRKAKGLDYGEDFRSYEMALSDIFGADGSNDNIDMTGEVRYLDANIPDANWNLD